VFIINSCGARVPFWFDFLSSTAGTGLVNVLVPNSNLLVFNGLLKTQVIGDTRQYIGRGDQLAHDALAAPDASIASAWTATMEQIPDGQGSSCPDMDNNFANGGGRGFNGCGGAMSLGIDATLAGAGQKVLHMTWNQVQQETTAVEATGNSFGYALTGCNYDCNTYGFQK
jgi:hypothetical protein